jgi:LytS/YehU family sensor histidine kinase
MSLVVFCALAAIGQAQGFARRERLEAERAARAETLRAEAHLAALRAQLNPHFILNLLHSLLGLVGRDPAAAAAGIERLGDLLRHALRVQRQDGDRVALRDELAFVEDYLALERLRLGERLRVTFDVAPELLTQPVPAFVLQPLVENAVRYAVAPRKDGGSLRIAAAASDGVVRFTVADDGAPAPEAQRGEGVGLRLVRERLDALYDGSATLAAGPRAGGGFLAEVSIPRAVRFEEEG